MKKIIFNITIITSLLLMMTNCSSDNGSSTSSKKIELSQSQVELIENFVSQGFLEINASLNKVHIDNSLWSGMKASLKEDFSYALAIYVGNKKGTQLYWCDIHDMYSGKKIAKYSKSWGFKVY